MKPKLNRGIGHIIDLSWFSRIFPYLLGLGRGLAVPWESCSPGALRGGRTGSVLNVLTLPASFSLGTTKQGKPLPLVFRRGAPLTSLWCCLHPAGPSIPNISPWSLLIRSPLH